MPATTRRRAADGAANGHGANGANGAPTPAAAPSVFAHALRMATVNLLRRSSSIDPRWRKQGLRTVTYTLSSLLYTVVGLITLLGLARCPQAVPEWPVAVAGPEAVLVALQGLWSYWSDVACVGLTSWAHPVDRVGALPLTALQCYKWLLRMPRLGMSPREAAFMFSATVTAVGFKTLGYRAILARDMAAYRRSHTLWHTVLPLAVVAFNVSRWRAAHLDGRCSALPLPWA